MNRNRFSRHTPCFFLLLLFVLLLTLKGCHTNPDISASSLPEQNRCFPSSIQKDLSQKIIRYHVIAASDSYHDQALKLIVKDEVLSYLQKKMSKTASLTEARQILIQELPKIKKLAEEVLRSHSCYDSVSASLSNVSFPIKIYGNLAFPAGVYEACRIRIGKAEGKNWWCVLYPSLCLTGDSIETSSLNPDSKTLNQSNQITSEAAVRLKEEIGTKDYDALLQDEAVSVQYGSWLLQKLHALCSHF